MLGVSTNQSSLATGLKRTRRRHILSLLLSMLTISELAIAGGTASAAASSETTFEELYERALAAYQAGSYAAAIEDLLAAHKLHPEPRLLFNIAQSYRKLGDFRKAKQFFELHLERDKDISAEMKVEVERYVSEFTEPQLRSRQGTPTDAAPVPIAPQTSSQLMVRRGPEPYAVKRWHKTLGSLLVIGGAGLTTAGVTFLAIDGQCTAEPAPPAVECGRVYQVLAPGAAQAAVGGGLLVAGMLTLVIPYLKSAQTQRALHDREPRPR